MTGGNAIIRKASDEAPQPASNGVTSILNRLVANDSFSNVPARMGYGTPNLLEGTTYPLVRMTQNYQLLNSLYRNNWIVRRIVNLIPKDMMKNGWNYTSGLTPEQNDKLQKAEQLTKIHPKLRLGLEWGRLYGGAAGLMMIEGQEDELDQPLDLESIMPGDFKGILLADRWSGVYPEIGLVDDISSPEFGLPKYYRFQSYPSVSSFRVHHTRILRFLGTDLPLWEQWAEVYWGGSIIESVFDEIKKRDNTSYNIAGLIFQAKLKVLKMNDFGELLAAASQTVQSKLYQTLQAQNQIMSNFGTYVMNATDNFESMDYSFTGISEVYEQFMMDVSGAAQIPVTKLFGRSPAGMNATGESDMRNYYDNVATEQEDRLRPPLEKLLPVVCMSTLGEVPDDLDFGFNPIYESTDEEKGKKLESYGKVIFEGYNSGLYSQKVALKELKTLSDDTGAFTNITDKEINEADEDVIDPMEQMMAAGGEIGAPQSPKAPGKGGSDNE